jgi:hypothetical protein
MPNLSEIESALSEAYKAFYDYSHIEVSERAKSLILSLYDALAEEPDPNWEAAKPFFDDVASLYLQHAKLFLPAIYTSLLRPGRPLPKQITYFDVLHWVTQRGLFLKPFQPRQPGDTRI